jgi:hypothetical protein
MPLGMLTYHLAFLWTWFAASSHSKCYALCPMTPYISLAASTAIVEDAW